MSLSEWLTRPNSLHLGQIVCACLDYGYELRHRDDAERSPFALTLYEDPEDAAQIALYDDTGAYRPLKTAPNLRHGWRLVVVDPPHGGWRWTCSTRRGWAHGRRIPVGGSR